MISPLGFFVHSRDADHVGPALPVFAVVPQGESVQLLCQGFAHSFVLLPLDQAAPCDGHGCRACSFALANGLLCMETVGEFDVCGKPAPFFTRSWEPRCAEHKPEGGRAP